MRGSIRACSLLFAGSGPTAEGQGKPRSNAKRGKTAKGGEPETWDVLEAKERDHLLRKASAARRPVAFARVDLVHPRGMVGDGEVGELQRASCLPRAPSGGGRSLSPPWV